MRLAIAILLISVLGAGRADAALTVNEQILQKGQYAKASCTPDPKEPDYDDCICDADVRYPQLDGMGDRNIQDKFNRWFRDQASKAVCEGAKVETPVKNDAQDAKAHMSVSVHYETTFSSEDILAFRFTDWAYTGGAHGNGSVIGVILDLKHGKLLGLDDLLPAKRMEGVNKVIYDTLIAKPEEEIFRDQIESRKGEFIKDGQCRGCTLALTSQGLHVLFQTYEVAPYGAGDVDVLIPQKYVSNAEVLKALQEPKKTTAEKK